MLMIALLFHLFFFFFLPIQTYRSCLYPLLSLDSFTPNLSYLDLPLHHPSGSPPHHPLNPTPDYPRASFKPPHHRVKFLMCKYNHVFSSAWCSLWFLVMCGMKSQLHHHLALPTCSALSSGSLRVLHNNSMVVFFPVSMHLHIYSSCLK